MGQSEFDAQLFDKILLELSAAGQPFDGERYVPGAGVKICYEHFHRYLFAGQLVSDKQVVLDIGCGMGYGSVLLALKAAKVIALDINADSVNVLSKVAKQEGLNNLSAHVVDLNNFEAFLIALTDNIDVVVCHEVIEHLPEPLQRSILQRFGSATAPFSPSTKFLLSTPDKELYDDHRESPNPFHLREWTAKEFQELLESYFKHVRMFEQDTASMNFMRQARGGGSERVELFELGWQKPEALIPGLAASVSPKTEFVYAVASQQALDMLPKMSLLVDASDQLLQERFSLAAHELRELKVRNRNYDQLVRVLQQEMNLEDGTLVRSFLQDLGALKTVIARQGDKIASLQAQVERIGAKAEQAKLRADQEHLRAHSLEHYNNQLKPWHAMGGSLLGPTPEGAAQEVYRLRACEAALRTPAHRLVSVVGRAVRAVLPMRLLRRTYRFVEALAKA